MPYTPTEHWEKYKIDFLSHHAFNSQIESVIKAIERKMAGFSFLNPLPIERFSANTRLPLASARRLVCLCIANAKTREFAPFYLYFASSEAIGQPDKAINAIIQVKQELGW